MEAHLSYAQDAAFAFLPFIVILLVMCAVDVVDALYRTLSGRVPVRDRIDAVTETQPTAAASAEAA